MQYRRNETISRLLFLLSNAAVLISVFNIGSCSSAKIYTNNTRFRLHSDASALLSFKSNADLWNKLDFYKKTGHRFCQWRGVTCYGNRVVRLVIEDLYLGGELGTDSLSRLDQLRVLSLRNNSLTGTIPDFSGLVNLKSLFLNRNSFSGPFPLSLLSLHRLRTVDISFNNLNGPIPAGLIFLDRLIYLRLESNRFNGTVPALNQSSLQTFNVSVNDLTGAVPVTATLQRFSISSFLANPNLCGLIVHRECHPTPSFFGPATPAESGGAPPPAIVLGLSAEVRGVESNQRSHKRITAIIGLLSGGLILIASIFCFIISVRRRRDEGKISTAVIASDAAATAEAAAVIQMEQESELEAKVKKAQLGLEVAKSGSVVFCAGEAHMYSMDQLMRASAELLGRGTMGTTYKAVLDNRLIVCVKRLDAIRLAGLPKENFVRHMESVGALRHPNLVPLRAYFQAKEERLLIYDYQPNGSLSSLVHGTKSTRAKPLHWTSCLKIAEDVAQGLSYIHQAWRLVHGNLKSSNVLLGPEFEACIADYCLPALINNDHLSPLDRDHHDSDSSSSACKAPETRGNSNPHTTKSDVYSFGILLLELLTGKQPSELPCLPPDEMVNWVSSVRDGDDNEGSRLWMLCEVAVSCSLVSPEQRPTMWQVLKMLQEIKEAAVSEDTEMMTMETSSSGMS